MEENKQQQNMVSVFRVEDYESAEKLQDEINKDLAIKESQEYRFKLIMHREQSILLLYESLDMNRISPSRRSSAW